MRSGCGLCRSHLRMLTPRYLKSIGLKPRLRVSSIMLTITIYLLAMTSSTESSFWVIDAAGQTNDDVPTGVLARSIEEMWLLLHL